MSYKLKLSDRVDRGVRRVGVAQIDAAIGHLRSDGETASIVHATRKSMKKLRSLLRMVRSGLSDGVFERENARFRDIARQLSDLRDSHVLVATLDVLQHGAEGRAKRAIEAAAKQFRRMPAGGSTVPGTAEAAPLLMAVAEELEEARSVFAKLEVDGGHEVAFVGVTDIYRKARRGLHHAFASGDPDDLHEFRKATQHHWRHMQLLSVAWPEYFDARATTARRLSVLLGDDHDLALLADVISAPDGSRGLRLSVQRRTAILDMIRVRQQELQPRASRLGQQLLADPPGAFRDAITFYWKTALDGRDKRTTEGRDGQPYAEPRLQVPAKPHARPAAAE